MKEGTFSEACYNQNSIQELKQALRNGADEVDCKVWKLTDQEWKQEIKKALIAKLLNRKGD